jgi:hypothetical protein
MILEARKHTKLAVCKFKNMVFIIISPSDMKGQGVAPFQGSTKRFARAISDWSNL